MTYEFQKRYYFWLFFLFLACTPDDLVEDVYDDYFSKTEQELKNQFDFTLESEGTYFITILDSQENVITREKFKGVIGKNTKQIYTDLLPNGGLYLVLQDENKNEIGNVKLVN